MTMQKMGGRNERKSTQLVRSSVGDEVVGDDDRRFQEEEEENGTGEGKWLAVQRRKEPRGREKKMNNKERKEIWYQFLLNLLHTINTKQISSYTHVHIF